MMQVGIINGPNLNLIGTREPEIYGRENLEEYFKGLQEKWNGSINIIYVQTNDEGKFVDFIQDLAKQSDALILNPGAYTHTSIAIRDAVAAISIPVAEVHLSDIYEREEFRKTSFLKGIALINVKGLGIKGYEIALTRLAEVLK